MATDIEKRIKTAEKKTADMEKRLAMLTKLFLKDGEISTDEAKALEKTNAAIAKLKGKVTELKEKNGVFDFSDEPMVIEVNTGKKFGEAKYFSDNYYKELFNKSINIWALDKAIKLNSVSGYMNREKSPSGLSVMDLLPIITVAFPQAKVAGALVSLAPMVLKAFEQGLRAAKASTPSLNEIHGSWVAAIDKLTSSDLTKQYNEFVEAWKAKEGIGRDVDQAWTNVFGPACSSFAKTYMPDGNTVQRAFMGNIIATTEDSWDFDSNAGDAEIEILELAGNWSSPEGQLDDVPEVMFNAFKEVFKGARVIDMPVEINVIVRNVMGANMCEIQRKSHAIGNTAFKHVGGEKSIYEDFMKKKIYNMHHMRHLSIDS